MATISFVTKRYGFQIKKNISKTILHQQSTASKSRLLELKRLIVLCVGQSHKLFIDLLRVTNNIVLRYFLRHSTRVSTDIIILRNIQWFKL